MFRSICAFLWLSLCLWTPTPQLLAADSDSVVQQRLQSRLSRSSLRHDTVSIRVVKGVVTIEGSVSNIQRKGVATRFARDSGAIQVVNLLKVNDGRPEQPLKILRVLP